MENRKTKQDLLSYDLSQGVFPQIRAEGVNEGLYKALWLLKKQKEVPSRDGTTREVLNCRFIHTEPRDRIIRLAGRKHNFFSQLGETLWVLSGSNQLKFLELFLPRAKEFSDDGGVTWRSGYGPRLRNYPSKMGESTDQVREVVGKISKSLETRRAFIVLTYPPVDHSPGVDVVCNVALQFIVREGQLCMTIHNRSNDSIWGYSGINFFEFTFLQELIRSLLAWEHGIGLELGPFVHNSVSYHVYSRHYERMEGILNMNGEAPPSFDQSRHFPVSVESIELMDYILDTWLSVLEELFEGSSVSDSGLSLHLKRLSRGKATQSTLAVYAMATLIYVAIKHNRSTGPLDSSLRYWRTQYAKLCSEYQLDPYKTYFLEAITNHLPHLYNQK